MNKVKRVIDVLMLLMMVVLMGYSFTGNAAHEIVGVSIFVLFIVHHILNYRWFTRLHKGKYNKIRIINTILIVLIFFCMIGQMVTAITLSRLILPDAKGVFALSTAQLLHKICAYTGFIGMCMHAALHIPAFRKHKAGGICFVVIAILIVVYFSFGKSYIQRHYIEANVNRSEAVKTEQRIDTGDRKVLTVYFTRVGNSDFSGEVDAVSGASLMVENGTLIGNAELLCNMADSVLGTEGYAIRTKVLYPKGYSETCMAAKKEMDSGVLSELSGELPDVSDVTDVILFYPLWWFTVPTPVESFLREVDLSGKNLYICVTHGGSGEGHSISDIKGMTKAQVSDQVLTVYDDDCREAMPDVSAWLEEIFQ